MYITMAKQQRRGGLQRVSTAGIGRSSYKGRRSSFKHMYTLKWHQFRKVRVQRLQRWNLLQNLK